jgi:multicomponent Na+:H+ antiporter subunit E
MKVRAGRKPARLVFLRPDRRDTLETGFIGSVRRFLLYVSLLLLLWFALTAGNPAAGWFGIPLSLGGALVALKLLPAKGRMWSLAGLIRFVPWFVRESLLGGADVARGRCTRDCRSLLPSWTIPRRCRKGPPALPGGPDQPAAGTLSAEWKGGELRIHVLDEGLAVEGRLRLLERRVADLFGLETTDPA